MPGKFENGQTNSDRRHKQHGNNHLADKKIGTHESKKKHAPVGDDDAKYYYSKSQKGFGPPMKKAAVSNYKKPESKFGRSPNKHDQNADCTYAIEQTDTNAGHLNKNQIMRSEHGQSDAQHGREKIHHLFHQDNGFGPQNLPSETKWVARKVSQCAKHFRDGFFALKRKMMQHLCINELCWDGYSRKPCAFTMYAETMEQCADAVARNPVCGTQFSYSWGNSLCDCAPFGGYCTLKAYSQANILQFFKLPSLNPIISSTTAFATNTNPDVSVVVWSKSALVPQTTIRQSTIISSDPSTPSSRKSTASSHIATLSGATRFRPRPDELTTPAQKTTHSIRLPRTRSPPCETTQAIKDSSTRFTDFSITSQRSTVQTPNGASSVIASPSPAPNRAPSPQPETLIPYDCMDWFDGCQNCVVHKGQILMCTNRLCYDLTSGFCREFKDGRLCQDVDCLEPSYATKVYLRTTRNVQNMSVRGNTTSGSISQPVSDTLFGVAMNAHFVVTMTIMGMTTVILFAVLMIVGSFVLNKNKRKRQQKVTAKGSGTLRQNAPITKHLKQLRSALSKHPLAIQWSEDGKSFYVPDRQLFERVVLGDHALGFKTQSFKNWAQKLRRHGFKLHKGTGGKLVGGRYSREDGLFTRDHPELDGQISRLKSANSKTSDQPLHLVDKLRAAITRYPRIIHWSEDGLSFRVSDLRGFESKVLTDKKVGFRCSTYRNWARNLRNYGFEAVSFGKGKKGGPRRVWQHTGGHFQRDRPRLSNGKSNSPDTKRFRIECDGTLVNGTLISEIVPGDAVPTVPTSRSSQHTPIGLPARADALTCPELHFDEDSLLESANLITLGDDSGRLHVGSFSPHLPSFSSRPGSFSSRPGSFSSRPGSFSSHPGSISPRLGSFSSRPGSFSSRPGSFSSHPGSFSRHGSLSRPGSFSNLASCAAHANEYDVMDCKAADELSDLLSTNESDLHLQLQMCQEDYVHELCI